MWDKRETYTSTYRGWIQRMKLIRTAGNKPIKLLWLPPLIKGKYETVILLNMPTKYISKDR